MDRFEIKNAPCQSANPEIFFPDPTDLVTLRQAKETCAKCNATLDCLSFALKTNSQGVWAGTTDEERKSIKRKMQRSK
jgi:WhiB family redox-sensing transcriptional regulator